MIAGGVDLPRGRRAGTIGSARSGFAARRRPGREDGAEIGSFA